MTLPPERVQALRVLHEVTTAAGWRCVLIGASAPALLVSSEHAHRRTFDADVIVSTKTWADYETLRQALEVRGFRRGASSQMFGPEDARIDLIPFGAGIVDGNQIAWPDGSRMSALGLAEALETARPSTVEGTFAVDVAPLASLVLLKLISYQDRPEERHRDVADVIAICEEYESDSDRRYDAVGEVVDGEPVTFDVAGAFVLGRALRAIAHADSLASVGEFFARIPDQNADPVRHVVTEETPTSFRDERRPQVFHLFRVLRAGMGLTVSSFPGSAGDPNPAAL